MLGGAVATQYVDVHIFATVAPGLVGLAVAWAASAAAGRPAGAAGWRVGVIAAVMAVLSAGLAFRLVTGGQDPLGSVGDVGPPYLAAVLGTLAWPLLFGPPKRGRVDAGADQPDGRTTP
jgi:hypothetical protein